MMPRRRRRWLLLSLPLAAAAPIFAQTTVDPAAPFSAIAQPEARDTIAALELPSPLDADTTSSFSAIGDTLPDAPGPQTTAPDHPQPAQTKRILGIMPNFRSVSADEHLPPQTVKDKFVIAAKDSFDYSSFVIAGIQSGVAEAEGSYPEFGGGITGYGQYFWHTLLDTADENFMVGGAFPALFHQDSRFYTLGHGNAGHRALYAASRILISRSDSGRTVPNFAEVIGAGAAAGVSSTYYPEVYRTWTKVGQKWLTSMIIDSANFTFKEFWPNINSKLFHTH